MYKDCTLKILGNRFHWGFYGATTKLCLFYKIPPSLVQPNILSTFSSERSSSADSAVSSDRKLSSNFYEVDLDKF